jgi:UDP-N-acetylglucosamine--N-acetylmuramyl-(pentapeptide) pyrophosphoryl-undecaprenol N-acetylglucosamine transferase
MSEKFKVLISASGTGGHLIPAQRLAEILKKKNCDIFFAAHGLSTRLFFQKENFSYLDISSSMINKKNIFIAFFKIFKGLIQSLKLLIKYKPNVVVGFGGYHTFPVVLASFLLRKKIILYNSDLILGRVNRVFSKIAKVVAVQFEMKKLKNSVLVQRFPWGINNDLKQDFIKGLGFDSNVFTILIFGGSQGSKIINDNFIKCFKNLIKNQKIQVIHILGGGYEKEKIKDIYDEYKIKSYVSNFERNLFDFYKISDLVISRSGACTISEIIHFGKPSILIPFKGAKDNHQYENALYMQNEIKMSSIILEDNLTEKTLYDEILSFFEDNKKKLCLFKENVQKFKTLENNKNIQDLSDLVLEVGIKK